MLTTPELAVVGEPANLSAVKYLFARDSITSGSLRQTSATLL